MRKLSLKSRLAFLIEQFNFFAQHTNLSDDICLFISCQFALESNFGTSKLSKTCNNLSGMRYPHVRFSLANGVHINFSNYSDLDMCRFDYLIWLAWTRFSVKYDLSDFKSYLSKSGYCPSFDYVDRISAIYDSYKSHFKIN